MIFFDALNREFNFTLDAASSDENALCEKHYTADDDGLSKSWEGETVFCNPPYCGKTGEWVKKCYAESAKSSTVVVALVPCRPDVKWFHDYVFGKCEIRFVRSRLKFGGKENAPFPSMVLVYGEGRHGYKTIDKFGNLEKTSDLVEVVRCKDCKWRGDEDACPMTYKDEWYDEDDGWDFRIVDQADDDGFCHKGERDDE